MKHLVHAFTGTAALATTSIFWIATTASELFGSEAMIVVVKTAIPWGLLALVPFLAATGISGTILTGKRTAPLFDRKKRRMIICAINGVLVLVPAALYLASKAKMGEFDAAFYGVQALELLIGAVNISLLSLNLRDGMKLRRARQKIRRAKLART